MGESHKRKTRRQWLTRICFCVAGICILLLIPEGTTPQNAGAGKKPFTWNQAQVWAGLEQNFVQARHADKTAVSN